jgi:hypothetical protein
VKLVLSHCSFCHYDTLLVSYIILVAGRHIPSISKCEIEFLLRDVRDFNSNFDVRPQRDFWTIRGKVECELWDF